MRSGIETADRPAARGRMPRLPLGALAGSTWLVIGYLFLWAPLIVVIGASFNGGTRYSALFFPPRDVSLKWYLEIAPSLLAALKLSLVLGVVASLVACLLAIPAALGLVRGRLPGRTVIDALFRAPMQIPAIVTGVGFLHLYYWIGDVTGLALNGTFFGLALGHIFVAMPYAIGSIVAILLRFDVNLEEAALSLGARPGYVTFPVELFFSMENDINPSNLATATLVIVSSFAAVLFVQWLTGLDTFLESVSGR